MSFREGLAAALGVRATLAPSASAVLGPLVPAPQLASPWVDRSALETITLAAMYGDTFDPDLLPLTRAEAMSVPAVARARSILATTLARLDLYVVDRANARRDGDPVAQLIAQPDPFQSRYVMLLWTVDDLIFHGVSWWQVTGRYAEDGRPRSMRRVLPGGVELHDGGRVTVYGETVAPRDLVRIDGPHEGILSFASRSLRLASKLEASAARFADNPVPAVELHQTDDTVVTKADKDALIAAWVAARRGANGGVAWTTRNLEAKVHGAPAEHLLTQGRNAQAIDVARHIGVPADTIDASPEKASQTYANREQRLGVLVDFGLAAYGAAITARLSMADVSPIGLSVAFDYDGITATNDTDPDTAPPTAPAAPAAPAGGPTP